MITAYHGTCFIFDKFDQGKARVANDFYGGGVAYFTTDKEIAKKYSDSMAKVHNSTNRVVYTVQLNFKKTFDVNHSFSGKELTKFTSGSLSVAEAFARAAGLIRLGVDKYDVISRLQSGDIEVTGDQVFKGISGGMVSTAKAREKLKSLGYDSLRYNGGQNMKMVNHDVYLAYDANDIKIVQKTILIPKNIQNQNVKSVQVSLEEY